MLSRFDVWWKSNSVGLHQIISSRGFAKRAWSASRKDRLQPPPVVADIVVKLKNYYPHASYLLYAEKGPPLVLNEHLQVPHLLGEAILPLLDALRDVNPLVHDSLPALYDIREL